MMSQALTVLTDEARAQVVDFLRGLADEVESGSVCGFDLASDIGILRFRREDDPWAWHCPNGVVVRSLRVVRDTCAVPPRPYRTVNGKTALNAPHWLMEPYEDYDLGDDDDESTDVAD